MAKADIVKHPLSPDRPVSSLESDVRTRLLYEAYARKPLNLALTALLTVVVGALLWRWLPATLLAYWIVAILSITALGYVECAAFRRVAPTATTIALWQHLFLAQSGAAGAAWALGPCLMLPTASGAQAALFVAILLCVCAIAMISVSGQQTAMQAFIAAALLPPAITLAYRGDGVEQMVALVLACGVVLMSLVGHRFNRATASLLENQLRTHAILDAAMDAIIATDALGRITNWNRRAELIFGWSWAEAIGLTLLDTIIPPEHQQAHIDGLARFLASGDTRGLNRRLERTARRRNGQEFPVELAIIPLPDGDSFEFVVFIADITERKQAQDALQENREKYRALSEAASEAIFISEQGRCLEQNTRAQEMFGYSMVEALGRLGTEWIVPQDRDLVMQNMLAGHELPYEVTALRKDGSTFPAVLRGKMMHYKGRVVRVTTLCDISERKQAEEAQRIAATAFESQQGMAITDGRRVILRVNKAFTDIAGYGAEEVVGHSPRLLASDRHDPAFYTALWAGLARDGTWQGEIWNRRKNGEVFPAWFTISAVKDAAGRTTHYVAAFTDISSRKSAEDQIRNLAFYDPLTHLPNRRLLLDRLEKARSASARRRRSSALLFIDLDHFKTVNDTLGHLQGDLLLERVASRLTHCVRQADTVARLGGDEFVVMLEDLSANETEAATQAKAISQKIVLALSQPYPLAHGDQHCTPSVGVALFGGGQPADVDEPLKHAELAMYQSKAAGRNTICFYDPQMQVEVTTRAALEADLHEAVVKNQFLLHFQAQVVGDGRLTGVEALVRWQHPQRGLVPPADFIYLAEETGLILPLGQWVLETACAQLACWAGQPALAQLEIAVNVSARQFHHPDFVDNVQAALDRSGADPRRLKLELTESLLVKDVQGVIAKMTALKARGVGFSLDDFGIGYSSLSYLKRLPLDQLKIDQSFVSHILTDPNDAAIAKMIIALAQSLGLLVIAEGVETEAQRSFLASQGCHAYQGYLFGRPLPIDQFEAYAEHCHER